MFRKTLALTLLLIMLIAGCAPAATPTEEPDDSRYTPTPVVPININFTDSLGTAVTINETPQRIVSLAPSVTETLFAIGAGGQVVGRTDYCNYPKAALELPSIGGFSAKSISIEAIIALDPDLVIGGSIHQAEVVKALRDAGIPAFVSQPENLEQIMQAVTLYGEITDHVSEADVITELMQTRMDAVSEKIPAMDANQRPTVFYEVWNEPLMSANNKTVIGELIELAGGRNIFAQLPDQYPTISAEQVIEVDPQFIIGPSSHGDQLNIEAIGAREGWQNLKAVQNKAIYTVDGDIVSRYTPRIVDILEEFAKILYPDVFK